MQPEHIILEEKLLNILLNSKEAIQQWGTSPINSTDFFDPIHRFILGGIRWSYDENVQLTRPSFKAFLEEYVKVGSEVVAQIGVFNRISLRMTKRDELPMLVSQIKNAYVKRKTTQFFKEYAKDRDSIGSLEANRILSQKLTTLDTETTESRTACVDIAEHKDKFMADLLYRRANPISKLKCGISEIDDTMGVGFKEGTVTLFCGGPGGYKSTMMMNVAVNMFKNSGENIMFLPLEMPWDMMLQKIVSRETRIPFSKYFNAEVLTDEEISQTSIEMNKWTMSNRFKLLKIGDKARVSSIRGEIEKRFAYFKPRVVFIDYLDNVIPESKNLARDLQLRDLFDDIIRMSERYNFATVSAAKLSRIALQRARDQKEGQFELDTTDLHGGQELGGNAMNIYGQIKSAKEPEAKLDFFCIKSRYASNTFSDGKAMTQLRVIKEIGHISSQSDALVTVADNKVVEGYDSMPDPEDTPF